MKRKPIAALALVVLAGGCAGGGGSRATVDRADAALPGTFGQVAGLVELRDGRVALVDFKDRTFLFARLDPPHLDTIGTHADTIAPGDPAPGRHKLPGQVIRFPGDTLALVDFAAERTTLWNEKGEFLATLHFQQIAGSNQPLVYDTLGYAYKADFRAIMGGLEPGGKVNTDSAPVIRFPREGTIGDTVLRLRLPEMGEGQFGETTKQVPTIFAGTDIFGVTPDGAVWVARVATNRVEWRTADGKWTHGPSRNYTKVPVTQADKDRFMENVRHQMQQTGGPVGLDIRYPFAAFKPPFTTGMTGPDGQVWLLRSRALDDSVPVYDVVGRDGRVLRRVELPKGTALLGFGGNGALYLAARGEDGRQKVQRFRLSQN
jgi:hypothetical protein